MVKQFSLILVIILVFTSLLAQVEEIPEINPDNLQDNWLRQLYSDLDAGNKLIKAQSRLRITNEYYNALLALQLKEKDLKLNTNFFAEEDGHLLANFTLSRIAPKSEISQLHTGSLRPAWGSGLIFGRNADAGGLSKVKLAPHPRYYSPLGAAGAFTIGSVSTFLLTSYQQRSADLNNDKIDRIYSSRREDIAKVDEAIAAGGVEYAIQDFALGGLFYYQNYDLAFSSTDYSRVLEALSLAAKVKGDIVQLEAEAGIIEGKSALQASARVQIPGLEQNFGFSYREGLQLPAYAAKPSILSSLGERHELSWDLNYSPAKDVRLGFRNAISRQNRSVQASNWLSRNILFFNLSANPTAVLAQLTRLDRELVTAVDTSFIHTRPVHYRLKLHLDHDLSKYLQFSLQFRYHLEGHNNWENNTVYWENAFTYHYKSFVASAGIKTWQGLHGITIPDENGETPEGTYNLSSEGDRFYLASSLRWKTLRLKAELQKAWTGNYQSLLVTVGI